MRTEDTDQPRSLTDPWILSEDVHNFNANTLLAAIMNKGAQMEPLYATDPIFFYRMNKQWWEKWYPTFDSWCKVLEQEYEPLWDRNGYEEVHEDTYDVGTNDTVKGSTEVMDDDTSYSKSGSKTTVEDEDLTNHSITENTVSAYNADTYQPNDKSEVTGQGTDDKTTTENWSESGTGTDDRTTTFNETTDNDSTNDKDFDRTYHSWGNWGISQTSQKLLQSELEVRYFNIYDRMSDIFLDEMAVRVF